MTLSQRLAKYIVSTAYDDLPQDVVNFTKLCILDYFGSAFAGSSKEPVKMIDRFVHELGGDHQATLITGGKTSVTNAALVNGASSHIVELDDIHKASVVHAATVVIPAALAITEWKKLSGNDFITAVVIGYDVCYRIGEAVTPSHYYYWHNTATCGTYGAAAAAAKLLHLSEEAIINTLGSAGTQAAGFWEFIEDGAMSKQLHPGKAAMNGVMSALLAQKGFTGAKRILEGDRGFFNAMSDDYDISKITNGLGRQYKITENSFKIHASCRHTHHAMDLMIEFSHENKLNLDDIEQIVVKTYQAAINITDNDNPETVYAAKFSMQYCAALAFVTVDGGLDQFNHVNLWDDKIRKLMKRIRIEKDTEIDRLYPKKWGATVEIKLKNGEVIIKHTDFPKGDPENPVIAEELLDKFKKLTVNLPPFQRDKFADYVMKMDTLKNLDELMRLTEVRQES